jgi:hypothetical protein
MTVDHESLARSLTRPQAHRDPRPQLDSLLDEAAKRELTLGEALAFLVEREIARKDERRVEMAGNSSRGSSGWGQKLTPRWREPDWNLRSPLDASESPTQLGLPLSLQG